MNALHGHFGPGVDSILAMCLVCCSKTRERDKGKGTDVKPVYLMTSISRVNSGRTSKEDDSNPESKKHLKNNSSEADQLGKSTERIRKRHVRR